VRRTRRPGRLRGATGTRRRWKFVWVALVGLLLVGLGGVAEYRQLADPGVDLTVLRDDGQGHCTVRWIDPLDGRARQGPFACDSDRVPILRDREYGWEVSYWPWRGDLYNADGVGTRAYDVMIGLTLSGLALLLVAGAGGTVRIARGRRARAGAAAGRIVTPRWPAPRGHGRRGVSPRVKTVLLLAGGAVALTVSGGLFGVELPDARQREKDFRAAVPCPATATATTATVPDAAASDAAASDAAASGATAAGATDPDCLSTERFTVKKVHIHRGRDASYTADLAGPGSASVRRVHFGGDRPLLHRLHPGDTVRGTLWRSGVVAVASDDGTTRQATSADPTGDVFGTVVGGIVLAVIGTGLAVLGGCSAYRILKGRIV